MIYICTWRCYQHQGRPHQCTDERPRHPVAFPEKKPRCPLCDFPMILSTFTVSVDAVVRPPVRKVLRREIRKGSLPLFPEFSA